MLLDVWFDGYKITDYCMVRNIFPLVAGRGANLLLEINITIKNDIRYNLDKLNQILFTKESRPLIISDNPERQLMCELNGGIELTSRFVAGDATLSFVAEEPYWYSTEGEKSVFSDGFGTINLTNEGTAPALPRFTVDFPTETGFLSIVAPNGYLALGDKEEKTKLELPMQQLALKETFNSSAMSGWTRLTSDSHSGGLWVPDYNKLSLTTGGEPWFDGKGIRPKQSTNPKSGYYWNTWGYTKSFISPPNQEHRLTNFKLDASVSFEDSSGTFNNTAMYLIVLMDKNNRPIMTTSMYNEESNSNDVIVTAKINSFSGGGNYRSKIIKSERFPHGFQAGNIRMTKQGNLFTWNWDSGAGISVNPNPTVALGEAFSVGDTVYIKNDARTAATGHSIAGFTRGRPHKVHSIGTQDGKHVLAISYGGVVVYHMYQNDLTKNRSGVGSTTQQTVNRRKIVNYSTNDAGLATLVADKVLIVGGTWDSSRQMNMVSLRQLEVQRLNEGDRFVDIANTFQKGDTLVIDNGTGEITHNGLVYQGKKDVDSRFFDIDYGPNELQTVTSSWGGIPSVRCDFTERYR